MSEFPIEEFSNIIGVIGALHYSNYAGIFTQKVLVLQPDDQSIYLIIQSQCVTDGLKKQL